MPNTCNPPPGGQRSVFRTVMVPLLVLLIVEAALLSGSLAASGVITRLDQNARDIFSQQLQNREHYLENSMVRIWSDLDHLAATVNAAAQTMLDDGTLSLETLDSSSDACAPLLLQVAGSLIDNLYAKRVSGIFLLFNTQELSGSHASNAYPQRTGIYIRDLDPTSSRSARNADLLLERAPIPVVKALDISTDTGWQPMFDFSSQTDGARHDFLFQPFQTAYHGGGPGDTADYGYWCAIPALLSGSDLSALSYSVPLILEDGTVYGVLGVDLLADYLQTLLPYDELFDDGQGAYMVAVGREEDSLRFLPALVSGNSPAGLDAAESLTLTRAEAGGYLFTSGGRTYYADAQPLPLYSTNSPFAGQQWTLIGTVPTERLYAFSGQVTTLLALAMALMLAAGVLGSFIISRRVSAPIRRLSQEVDRAQHSRGGIPRLSDTGIREIDRFSGAITALSRDMVNASTRFLRIMEMASVELGGFEVCPQEGSVFVTDNFFPLFGIEGVNPDTLTVEQFQVLFSQANRMMVRAAGEDGSALYQVDRVRGGVRYVRVEVMEEGDRRVGLAEDVTTATLERLRIEHERDYDLLTGLLNRRAFYRTAEALFQTPEHLGHAALVMLDLDNLKAINDRFGHDWGDQYIRQAGRCFAGGVPASALCSRVSGDEFILFFWGYQSREAVREVLRRFMRAIRESALSLPNGEIRPIQVSGGVSWYPDDSLDFHEMMKFADFAMYQVKHTEKGRLEDFDPAVYSRGIDFIQNPPDSPTPPDSEG